jgi:hypothetical protein
MPSWSLLSPDLSLSLQTTILLTKKSSVFIILSSSEFIRGSFQFLQLSAFFPKYLFSRRLSSKY